jgi:benzoyl-CoA reductase/2-hydroxyglutaryl-CoA dehydratase subunit BcrC/BadD/HgdB
MARRNKVAEAVQKETADEIKILKARTDYIPRYDYFLDLLEQGQAKCLAQIDKPVLAFLCQIAPLELIEAHGFHPFRLRGGHQAAERMSAPNLPAVMCPMLRSLLGELSINPLGEGYPLAGFVLPTMCDWTVKFGGMAKLCGLEVKKLHMIDAPRLKHGPHSTESWLKQTYSLNDFLAHLSGGTPRKEKLAEAVDLYREAYLAFSNLIDLKRRAILPQIWFSTICGSFLHDTTQNWTKMVNKVLDSFNCLKAEANSSTAGSATTGSSTYSSSTTGSSTTANSTNGKIFLAGSPIFFPDFKILHLLEEADLTTVIDDLCSSERILPDPVHITDRSFFGLISALSQRYQLGCRCPTFADPSHIFQGVENPFDHPIFQGVVFHVLKGCHLFDLKSLAVEPNVKEMGLRYLRLETDYAKEDRGALLTRLEAFRGTL